MTQVSSYFSSIGIQIDKASFAAADRHFDRLQSKMQSFGKTSNAFKIELKLAVDTARAKATIQRDLNTISNGLSLKINQFSLNNRALTNLLNQTMSTRTGAARLRLNAILSPASLTTMRNQVRAALDGLVVSPNITPRFRAPRIRSPYGYGAHAAGVGGESGFSLPFLPGPLLGFSAAAYAATKALHAAGSIGKAAQLQATRDVAARGVFENATMPDGSTRNVYSNSEQWFRNYTNRAGLDRSQLTPSFQGFMAASMPTLGYEPSRKVFEAFSSFGTVRGASSESMQRALVAVQQMASKGTVNAEELKQQLGDAQGFGESQILFAQAWQMMKNKTNNPTDSRLLKGSKSTAELGDAMKKNQLVASEILPIVAQLMLAKANPSLAAASQTGTANENRYNNAKTAWLENFAKGGGDQAMSNVWKSLADLVEAAARSAEMLGANFRVATAHVRVLSAVVVELDDFLSGSARNKNVFIDMFPPSLITAAQTLAQILSDIAKLQAGMSWSGMAGALGNQAERVGKAVSYGADLGWKANRTVFGVDNNPSTMYGPPVPANTPSAAFPSPMTNYLKSSNSIMNTNSGNIQVTNQVTVANPADLEKTMATLNLSIPKNDFLNTYDKAAFANSGQ